MVTKGKDLPWMILFFVVLLGFFIIIIQRLEKNFHCFFSSRDIQSISTPLKRFFTNIIRGQARHICKVPNLYNDIRFFGDNIIPERKEMIKWYSYPDLTVR